MVRKPTLISQNGLLILTTSATLDVTSPVEASWVVSQIDC